MSRPKSDARLLAKLREWREAYSEDIWPDPKPAEALSPRERDERSKNSAAMGRHVLDQVIELVRSGAHHE